MARFLNREDAGRQLGQQLRAPGAEEAVVLGIPRGGVIVAAEVARALGSRWVGVLVARKLGAPGHAELGIGAVTADGATYIDREIADETGASEAYIEGEVLRQVEEAKRREAAYDGNLRPAVAGRHVIVVDDGIATGVTAIAGLRSLRAAGASRVTLAVPVAPPDAVERLRREADEVVCLRAEEPFMAVGRFYAYFPDVSDEQVREALRAAREVAPSA